MAVIKNFYSPQQIEFCLELVKSESLIYKNNQPDYLNWFPCDFKLYIEEKQYSFLEYPVLSLEGLKNLLTIFEDVIKEKTLFLESINSNIKFKKFEYCATDGEFTISLKNTNDEYEENIVEITLWLNAAYYAGNSVGYYQGFRFFVSLNDLKIFLLSIQNQLDELMNETKV